MTTSENLPIRVVDLSRHERQAAASFAEVTAIYNRHANAEDAEKTAALIEPDSIVYNEGIILSLPGNEGIGRIVEELGAYKRSHGKDETYLKIKNDILEGLRSGSYSVKNNPSLPSFVEYQFNLIAYLLEKDCEILTVDYRHDVSGCSQEYTDLFQEILTTDEDAIFTNIENNTGTGKHYLQIEEVVQRQAAIHNLREDLAALYMQVDLLEIINNTAWYGKVPRSETGKIKTYVCYGTAHSRSLTAKLKKAGMDVHSIEVEPLEEDEYFDESADAFHENLPRRVAHAAFKGITYGFFGRDWVKYREVSNLMYGKLESMNHDTDGMIDFSIRCIKTYQHAIDDFGGAWQEYIALIRQYAGAETKLDIM